MDPVVVSLLVIALSVAAIVFLTLKWRAPAFLALMLVAIASGLAFGAKPDAIIAAIRKGMGDTLGFVAGVIGLGAILGALLEASGGVAKISSFLLARVDERRSPWVLALVGMIVGAPLFFEVAFVIVAPLLVGMAARSSRGVLYLATPALVAMGLMHALLPPHPGAIASAQVLNADFGQVLLFGLVCAVPGILIGGIFYTYLAFSRPGETQSLPTSMGEDATEPAPGVATIGMGAALFGMIAPVVLILLGSFLPGLLPADSFAAETIKFVGHPFSALTLSCVYVWVLLGFVKKTPLPVLGRVMGRALGPAGAITLVIGAGAAFKQVIVDSGVGAHLTTFVSQYGLAPMVFGFALAAVLRIAQGSATVAIVTSAGLTAPLVAAAGLGAPDTALVCIAIGCGSIIISHVNDAGFWLIKQYLGISEVQTLRSWTTGITIGGVVAFATALALSIVV